VLAQELRAWLCREIEGEDRDARLASLVARLETSADRAAPWLRLEKAPGGWEEDPACVRVFGFESAVNCIAVAGPEAVREGRPWMLVAAGDVIAVIDLAKRRELRRFEGHSDTVTSVAFSPDGCSPDTIRPVIFFLELRGVG